MPSISNKQKEGKRVARPPRKPWSQLTYREKARLTLEELDAYDAKIEYIGEHREWRRFRAKAESDSAEIALHGSAKARYESLKKHPTFKHLADGPKAVLHELYKAADSESGVVCLSVDEVMERTAMPRRRVQRALKTLRHHVFILRLEGGDIGRGGRGKPTAYQLNSYR